MQIDFADIFRPAAACQDWDTDTGPQNGVTCCSALSQPFWRHDKAEIKVTARPHSGSGTVITQPHVSGVTATGRDLKCHRDITGSKIPF